MFGHFNVNHDTKKVTYEYAKSLPLTLQGTISPDKMRKWSEEGRDSVQFETTGVDKLLFRGLSPLDLLYMKKCLTEVLDDLTELCKEV